MAKTDQNKSGASRREFFSSIVDGIHGMALAYVLGGELFASRTAAAATATAPAGVVAESGIAGIEAPTGEKGTVTKVWIVPGCIVCDLCEDTAPDVFHVTETTSVVQVETQPTWGELSEKIIESAVGCPVNVIKYELAK